MLTVVETSHSAMINQPEQTEKKNKKKNELIFLYSAVLVTHRSSKKYLQKFLSVGYGICVLTSQLLNAKRVS